jgi:hypothetical protein
MELIKYKCDMCGAVIGDESEIKVKDFTFKFEIGWEQDAAGGASTRTVEKRHLCQECQAFQLRKEWEFKTDAEREDILKGIKFIRGCAKL